jgi:peptide/nickel transport system permease protein
MLSYIVRRLAGTAIVMLGAATITFMTIFFAPVDPAQMMVGDRAMGVSIEHVREKYGLDEPIHIQYYNYLSSLARGDLGESFYFRRPVSTALMEKFPATAKLAISIFIVSLLLGIPLGMLAALRSNTIVDRGIMTFQLVALSLPSFFLSLLLLYFFAFQLGWFPVGGYGGIKYLVLPTLAVALPWSGWYAIFLRSSLLEVISTDYVRTAYAKGLSQRAVATRHMLRNAILPVVTMLGMDLATLLMGIALVEYVFSWPGIGWQTLTAATHFDTPLILGSVLLGTLLIGLGNLVVDIIYTRLDPRVRIG